MDLRDRIDILLDWCAESRIYIDPRLEVRPDANGGIGMFTGEEGVGSDETIVKIPKNTVLSARSCSLSQFIKAALVGPEAQLALSLALYSELLLDEKSEWYGYLQSLPEHIDLPICWEAWVSNPKHPPNLSAGDFEDIKEGLEWLRGTEVDKILRRKGSGGSIVFEDIKGYFYDIVQPTLLTHGGPIPREHIDINGFLRAYCLVSSRAFLVDAYHGLAMAPIADAFNHVQENHVHLETEHDVCSECGQLDECPHDRAGEERSSNNPSFSDDEYEIVTNAPIALWSEVFNTYGETLTNSQLLCQYGFILEANDNDVLTWTIEGVFDAIACDSEALRTAVSRTCSRYFRDSEFMVTFSDSRCLFSDSEGVERSRFAVNADGQVTVHLWILLTTISAHQTKQVPALLDGAESQHTLQLIYGLQIALENQVDNLDDGGLSDYSALDMLLSCIDGRYLAILRHSYRLFVTLFQTRKANTGVRGHGDETEIVALLDALDIGKRRTRSSLKLALNEKLVLSSCEATWKDLLVPLERVDAPQ